MNTSSGQVVLENPLLIRNILLNADYNSIINWCRTYQAAQEICRDHVFWEQKARQDFGTPRDKFQETTLSPAQRYLQLFTQNGGVALGSEYYTSMENFVKRAIHQGRNDLVQYAINLGYRNWEVLLREYTRKGDIPNVNILLHHVRPVRAFRITSEGAIEGGHIALFEWIQKMAPADFNWRWQELGRAAVQSGNKDMVDYIRTKSPESLDLLDLATTAVSSNNLDLFKYIYSLAPPGYEWDWQQLVDSAAASGNQALYEYMRSLVPPEVALLSLYLIYAAIHSGNVSLFERIRSPIPDISEIRWNGRLSDSLFLNHLDMFEHLWKLLPEDYPIDWQIIMRGAIWSEVPFVFTYAYSLIPPGTFIDWKKLDFYLPSTNLFFTNYVLVQRSEAKRSEAKRSEAK